MQMLTRYTAEKFTDPEYTMDGASRAAVNLETLHTLWIATGTQCNLACSNCYMDSSPRNDALPYISQDTVRPFLAEAASGKFGTEEIGFTGGEPFMNPELLAMVEDALGYGFRILILTNAMKPMQRLKAQLLDLHRRHPGRIRLRVSLDHYQAEKHEKVRGERTWEPTIDGLAWLSTNGFGLAVAGRMLWLECETELRAGYAELFKKAGITLNVQDPAQLVLFPEMDDVTDVPEISEHCWAILGKAPQSMMCASSRMVVHAKGSPHAHVAACTLLPDDARFDMGGTLEEACRPVHLNHRHCAKFCVLGGASCNPQNS